MKRYFKSTSVLFLLVMLTGCDLFGGGVGGILNKATQITVYNDQTPVTFTVYTNQQATIDSFTKFDHYLLGYYTEATGGTKYFDTNGKSTAIWQSSNPTVFYAQWGELSDLSFEDIDEGVWQGPKTFIDSDVGFYYTFENEFLNGIKGNLQKELTVTATFKLKVPHSTSTSVDLFCADGTGTESEKFGSYRITELSKEYAAYSVNIDVSASVAKNGKIYFIFDHNGSVNLNPPHYYVKDFGVKIGFKA